MEIMSQFLVQMVSKLWSQYWQCIGVHNFWEDSAIIEPHSCVYSFLKLLLQSDNCLYWKGTKKFFEAFIGASFGNQSWRSCIQDCAWGDLLIPPFTECETKGNFLRVLVQKYALATNDFLGLVQLQFRASIRLKLL